MCASRNLLSPSAQEIDSRLQDYHIGPAGNPEENVSNPYHLHIFERTNTTKHIFDSAQLCPSRSRQSPTYGAELPAKRVCSYRQTQKQQCDRSPRTWEDWRKSSTSPRRTWRRFTVAGLAQSRLLAAPAAAGPAPRHFRVLPVEPSARLRMVSSTGSSRRVRVGVDHVTPCQ